MISEPIKDSAMRLTVSSRTLVEVVLLIIGKVPFFETAQRYEKGLGNLLIYPIVIALLMKNLSPDIKLKSLKIERFESYRSGQLFNFQTDAGRIFLK